MCVFVFVLLCAFVEDADDHRRGRLREAGIPAHGSVTAVSQSCPCVCVCVSSAAVTCSVTCSAGDHGYRLYDAMRKRQQLIKLYEAIDGIR